MILVYKAACMSVGQRSPLPECRTPPSEPHRRTARKVRTDAKNISLVITIVLIRKSKTLNSFFLKTLFMALICWAGPTGVISRCHRKLAWNSILVFIVFPTANESFSGPLLLIFIPLLSHLYPLFFPSVRFLHSIKILSPLYVFLQCGNSLAAPRMLHVIFYVL